MEEKQWYVVNTYSGHENKVKEKLDMRIQSMNMQDYIFRVIVPEKTEIEIKDGVKKERVKKLLNLIATNPFQTPPSYEKLVGDLNGYYSRRINRQHRIVYRVLENEKEIHIIRMWTHYE